jgi:hypothetical protein
MLARGYGSHSEGSEAVPLQLLAASGPLFDTHIIELAGLKDLTALQALDVLLVIVAAYDLYARVFAWLSVVGSWRRRR